MSLDCNQTTKNKTRIFHIGLDKNEVTIIQGMLELHPGFKGRFVFGKPNRRDHVDMVFVNGDDLDAIDEWQALALSSPEVIPVIVCEKINRIYKQYKTIKKPIVMKKFVEIIDEITTTEIDHHENSSREKEAVNILVVDDSFPARQFMKYKLEEICDDSKELIIDFADTGEKALTMAEENDYDLVFLDLIMPGMDGYEICKKLKKINPVEIAMLTGSSAVLNRARAKHAGCDIFLAKPPADNDLKKAITKYFH